MKTNTTKVHDSLNLRPKCLKSVHLWSMGIFSIILIFDQLTKHLIRSSLSPHKSLKIIPGVFNIVYVMNKGGAFGILADKSPAFRGFVFIFFSIITIFALVIIYLKSKKETLTRFAIALLLGGAIGNLVDRIKWGMVVDFLDFYIGTRHWPAFNIADMAICMGLVLVIYDLMRNSISSNHQF